MSRVSVVIPMYNEARHIGRTLLAAQEAARQAQLECELIVVDNGSDDHGPRIANELGARVLIVPGVHIGALRNRGAAVASGEWLAFIDADMEMPADWLKLLVEMEGRQGDVLGLDLTRPRKRLGSPKRGSAAASARDRAPCAGCSGCPAPTC